MPKTLSLTAPNDVFDSMIEALCHKGNWQQSGDLSLGDAGKVAFAQNVLRDFVGDCLQQCETTKAREKTAKQEQAAAEKLRQDTVTAKSKVTVDVK